MWADVGFVDDDVGDAVAIFNVTDACVDFFVRGIADGDDSDAVAILVFADACDGVDAVAIFDFGDACDDFVIANGSDARANDAGAVSMGRRSGARPRRLPILILRIVLFSKEASWYVEELTRLVKGTN